MSDGDVRGFLHVCCIGGYREVTWEIIHALLESGLYDRSETIEMAVLGPEADQRVVENLVRPFARFHIAYRSTELDEYEYPTLGLLQDACQTWNGPVYYLHTKGVSYSPHNPYARYWRRQMLDEIVTNHRRCLAMLTSADTVGANWSESHYSGNFWWARSGHIRRQPDIRALQRNPRPLNRSRADGDPQSPRGVGPVWNKRLQCEYWLHMNPARAGRVGRSTELNLYRELHWTTSVADIVNELLGAPADRRFAELGVDGPGPHFGAVGADRKVFVPLRDFSHDLPSGGHDVILIDVRDDPRRVLNLVERCLPRLAPGGAVVVCHTNPPSAWHQRCRPGPDSGAEWTGQVWRAVVEFRIRHPWCEVFTVDTDWGCTVIRPSRTVHRRLAGPPPGDLDWRTLVSRRGELLNVVDVAWFRRHLRAEPYFAGSATPTDVTELVNALIAADGLDSYLQIGAPGVTPGRIIAPIRHWADAGAEATYRLNPDRFFAAGLGLDCYDVVLVEDPDDLERALTRVSDCGWIVTGRPPPATFLTAHPDLDGWTCPLDRDYTLIRRCTEAVPPHPHPADALLAGFARHDHERFPGVDQHVESHRPDGRRLTPQPYAGNVDMLLAAVELDPDDLRSTLYLGDAYFASGDFEAARRWYAQAVGMREWWWTGVDRAIYLAMLRIAQSMAELGEPWPAVQDAYLRAWELCPERTAPLHAIAAYYRAQQRYRLGYLHAKPAAEIPCPEPDDGRVGGEVENWRARDELALCAYEIGKAPEAFALWRGLLDRTDLPDADRRRIAGNIDDCVPAMLEVSSGYPEAVVRSLVAASGDPGVVVSLVAGPVRTAVEQTLNSFLNCCRDVSGVGRFLVVDVGLSPADRDALKERYGFLEFASTGSDRLADIRAQLDARVWLHLGGGLRFFAPGNLLTRLEAALEADPRVVAVHLLAARPVDGPAMFDTERLDRAGGFDADGLGAAYLGEATCVPQTMITVIGRGNSGTRAISHTLMRSGVFMGEPIKRDSADLVPADDMYEACRIIARHIPWRGGLNWDFGPVQTMPIPAEFRQLVESYLASVLASPARRTGWKLPETTLCYPWIRRLFPDVRYIFWVRNPRDCIIRGHVTDDLRDFGIECPPVESPYLRRAVSWKYQDDLVAATPRPRHWITVRMEDFVMHQERELSRLEDYLGFTLDRLPVHGDSVDRHKRTPGVPFADFLEPAMRRYGYEIPAARIGPEGTSGVR